MNAVALLVNGGAGVVLLHGAWWTLLSIAALPSPRRREPTLATTAMRLVVIVPAHNEERLIARCLGSLRAGSGGAETEILVVADNCTDATAEIARGHGATVLERTDAIHRGKGYALELAIRTLAGRTTPPDVVAFVDADSTVSDNFVHALVEAIAGRAGAVQVHYRAYGGTGEVGRLRELAFALVHWARPLGASRLGLGTSLKGNGMAIRWDIARGGLGSEGLAEDAAMSLELTRRGVAVKFQPAAWVAGEMAQTYKDAVTQDERWERGRFSLVHRALMSGGRAALGGHFGAAAGAGEVAALPLSMLVGLAGICVVGAALGSGSLALALAAAGSLVTYVGIGLCAARVSPKDAAALLGAPRFLLHKAGIYARVLGTRRAGWKRTDRPAGG